MPAREYKWRELGGRLKAARGRTALTQQNVADRLGVQTQTVWYWESGRSKPDHERLPHLAELYGVTTDWLLGGAVSARSEDYIDIADPEISLFFRGEWQEFTEEEQDFIKGMIRESRELLRKRRESSAP